MFGSGGSGGVTTLNGESGAINLVAGTNITITPVGQNITIDATGSSGANTALSNLASTAINTNLIFGTAVAGVLNTKAGTSSSTSLSISTGATSAGTSGNLNLSSGNSLGNLSGNINIQAGTSDVLKGIIVLDSSAIIVRPDVNLGGVNFGTDATTAASTDSFPLNIFTGSTSGATSNTGGLSLFSGFAQTGNSGEFDLSSGDSGTGNTGDSSLRTGNAASGNSGNIIMQIGTASGSRGKISLIDGSQGTAGYVWTSTNTSGAGAWMAPGSGVPFDSSVVLSGTPNYSNSGNDYDLFFDTESGTGSDLTYFTNGGTTSDTITVNTTGYYQIEFLITTTNSTTYGCGVTNNVAEGTDPIEARPLPGIQFLYVGASTNGKVKIWQRQTMPFTAGDVLRIVDASSGFAGTTGILQVTISRVANPYG